MNLPRSLPLLLVALTLGPAVDAARGAQKRKPPESDLASIDSRRVAVELAAKLAKSETPDSLLGKEIPKPFNPPGFNLDSRPVVATVATPGPAKTFGDHEILLALAPLVQPQGTLSLGSRRLLIFGRKTLRVGDRLTISYEGQNYSLELVAFDDTNFTLRLNHEEISRPIKPAKNP